MNVDPTDEQIIGVLRKNARTSYSEIGRQIGLSTNAVAARVRRLETSGVIAGYRVILTSETPERGSGLEAFIDVRLDHTRNSEEFLAWSARIGQIRHAVHVTGSYDYLLHVRVRDMQGLDHLLRTLKKDGGASHTQTRLALR